jgi:hypothetical protein
MLGALAGIALMLLLLFVPGATWYVLMSGAPLASAIALHVPDSFAYWVTPDGGPPASVALLLIGAMMLWGAGGAGLGALWRWRRTSSFARAQPTGFQNE